MPHKRAFGNDSLGEAISLRLAAQYDVESANFRDKWSARQVWLLGKFVLKGILT